MQPTTPLLSTNSNKIKSNNRSKYLWILLSTIIIGAVLYFSFNSESTQPQIGHHAFAENEVGSKASRKFPENVITIDYNAADLAVFSSGIPVLQGTSRWYQFHDALIKKAGYDPAAIKKDRETVVHFNAHDNDQQLHDDTNILSMPIRSIQLTDDDASYLVSLDTGSDEYFQFTDSLINNAGYDPKDDTTDYAFSSKYGDALDVEIRIGDVKGRKLFAYDDYEPPRVAVEEQISEYETDDENKLSAQWGSCTPCTYGCCTFSATCPYNWGKGKKCDYKSVMKPTKGPKPTKGTKPTKGPKPSKAPKTTKWKAPKTKAPKPSKAPKTPRPKPTKKPTNSRPPTPLIIPKGDPTPQPTWAPTPSNLHCFTSFYYGDECNANDPYGEGCVSWYQGGETRFSHCGTYHVGDNIDHMGHRFDKKQGYTRTGCMGLYSDSAQPGQSFSRGAHGGLDPDWEIQSEYYGKQSFMKFYYYLYGCDAFVDDNTYFGGGARCCEPVGQDQKFVHWQSKYVPSNYRDLVEEYGASANGGRCVAVNCDSQTGGKDSTLGCVGGQGSGWSKSKFGNNYGGIRQDGNTCQAQTSDGGFLNVYSVCGSVTNANLMCYQVEANSAELSTYQSGIYVSKTSCPHEYSMTDCNAFVDSQINECPSAIFSTNNENYGEMVQGSECYAYGNTADIRASVNCCKVEEGQ